MNEARETRTSGPLRDPVWRRTFVAGAGAVAVGLAVSPFGWIGTTVGVVGTGILVAVLVTDALAPLRAQVAALRGRGGRNVDTLTMRQLAADLAASREQVEQVLRDLRQERSDLEALLRGTADGILVLDRAQRAVLINEAAHRILSTPPDALGRSLQELVRHVELFELVEALEREGPPPPPLLIRLARGGARLAVRVTGVRLVQPAGTRFLLVLHDVTDLQRLERVRTDFVTNVTHEMRSPLASILGFAETLVDDAEAVGPEVADAAERIHRNARRLDDIVRDLVQLSRLEHATAPELKPTDLRALVAEAVAPFADTMEARTQTLEVDLEQVPELLEVDPQLVRQALVNLVENASKYGGEGATVRIAGAIQGERLVLSVADTGPGIGPEHQARIFERFYRVDSARARQVGGTGLGLSIVKHSAALHGGAVHLDSRVGAGTRFELVLPLAAVNSAGA